MLKLLAESKPDAAKMARSRVTNGRGMFIGHETDQRSPVARRLRDLIKLHTLDASPNGPEHLSAAQAQLIRRISMIEVQAELLEARLVDGDDKVDVESFARISSHLRRMYESLGLRKARRDTTPSIDELVARHRMDAQKAAANVVERAEPVAAMPVAPTSSSLASDRASPVEEAAP
ncbi:MAG TPA: hypothetical protein VIF02_01790 [Methylocella sp.]|jgi:hypothetical protein